MEWGWGESETRVSEARAENGLLRCTKKEVGEDDGELRVIVTLSPRTKPACFIARTRPGAAKGRVNGRRLNTVVFSSTQRDFTPYTAGRVFATFAGREMRGRFLGRGTRVVLSAIRSSGHHIGTCSNTYYRGQPTADECAPPYQRVHFGNEINTFWCTKQKIRKLSEVRSLTGRTVASRGFDVN